MSKPFPMDLSKFKKISSDKNSAVLRHPQGHEIKIALNALAPKLRSQLHEMPTALADGGEVADKKENTKTLGQTIGYPDAENPSPSPKPRAKYAEGTPDAPVSSKADSADQIASDAQSQAPSDAPPAQAPVVVNVNSGQAPAQQGMQAAYGQAMPPGAPIPVPEDPQGAAYASAINSSRAAQTAPAPQPTPQATPQMAAPAPIPESAPQQAAGAPKTPNDPYGTESYYNAMNQGINESKAGINKEAEATGAMGKAQAEALSQSIQTQQAQAKSFQDHYQDLDQERKAFQQDVMDQHIDPNHYLGSKDTVGKVATGIGLILGGMGAGLAGGENQALKFINAQIDRDIDAQKANLGKSETLLNANMKQFGNLKDATEMTRVMQMDLTSNELKKAAATAADPLAKARALQAAGQLDMQTAPILSQIAMRKTLLGGMQAGQVPPENIVRAFVPPEHQAPAYKELQEAQNMSRAKDNILSAFDQITKLQTVANRAGSPIQSKAQIDALRQPIVAGLSKETAGRFTEQDAQAIDKLFPDLKDNAETAMKKRIAINKIVSEKMNFPLLKSYGIDASTFGRYKPSGASGIPEAAPVIKQP